MAKVFNNNYSQDNNDIKNVNDDNYESVSKVKFFNGTDALQNKEFWNFTSEDSYVCYLNLNGVDLPVTQFIFKSSISLYYELEVFVLSIEQFDPALIYKSNVTLNMFYDSSLQTYGKIIPGKIYKVFSQGVSYLLRNQQYTSDAPIFYLYKLIIYPDLYQLTFKTRNYIYKNEESSTGTVNKLDIAQKIIKDDYNLSLSVKVISEELEKCFSVTQYQETDFEFLVRIVEESNLLLYYDMSSSTPELTISKDLATFGLPTIPVILNKPYNIHGEYKFDDVQILSVSADGEFTGVITSYNIYAGSMFSVSTDLTKKYFVNKVEMKMDYKPNGTWVLNNYIYGFVLPTKSLLKRTTKAPNVSGFIRSTIVSNTKNSFHVDQNGRMQVRYLWDTNVIDSEENFKNQDISDSTSIDTIEENKVDSIDNGVWDVAKESSNVTTWIPYAQWGAAGNKYGNFNFPRAGQEVLVFFLEGNIDNPMIIGSVFNADNIYPDVVSFDTGEDFAKNSDSCTSNIKEGDENVSSNLENVESSVNLKSIPQDQPLKSPNLSKVAGDCIIKHYGYNDNNETVDSGYNEIYFENTSGKEKLHFFSTNLINIRSKNEMHTQIDNANIGVYGSQRESILNTRATYIFNDDFYNNLNSKRISFFVNYDSGENAIEESAMLALQLVKVNAAEAVISKYLSGVYDLSIYDNAMKANVIFRGNYITAALNGNVGFILPLGTFSVVTNLCDYCVAGGYIEVIGGYRTTTIMGYYSINVAGLFSIDCSRYSIDVGTLSVKSGSATMNLAAFSLKAANTNIEFAKFDFKAGKSGLDFGDFTMTTGKTSITTGILKLTAGDVSATFGNLNIKCANFSLTSANFNVKGAVLVVQGATITLTAPLITLMP